MKFFCQFIFFTFSVFCYQPQAHAQANGATIPGVVWYCSQNMQLSYNACKAKFPGKPAPCKYFIKSFLTNAPVTCAQSASTAEAKKILGTGDKAGVCVREDLSLPCTSNSAVQAMLVCGVICPQGISWP